MKIALYILIALQLTVTLTLAANPSSAERGKELFNDTKLGSNGKSCGSCHPGGKDLEKVASLDTKKLEKIINQCITKALKGKALAEDSADLSAIVSYLKTKR